MTIAIIPSKVTSVFASSEALFGSMARTDSDGLSDRDYLILHESYDVLKSRSAALSAEGKSVASYTFIRLNQLAQKGGLFVQHLKQDAKIYWDENLRLGNILSGYQPKTDYSEEIKENYELARLCSSPPNSLQGFLWAADVAYVALRNYAILRLAERKVYEFSFNQLLHELMCTNEITADQLNEVAHLRTLKSFYRADLCADDTSIPAVLNALSALPSSHFQRRVMPIPIKELARIHPQRENFKGNYAYCRAVERWLIARSSVEPSLLKRREYLRLQRAIRDPRQYSFQIKARFDALVSAATS